MLLLFLILGYLIGSIPWGLIIGKVFFQKDIRDYGSGNLGGTNAGRVLGKYYGWLVIAMDASKGFLVAWMASSYSPSAAVLSGMMCAIGHCYPLFAEFRGGKAVACTFGYYLALGLFVSHNLTMFLGSLAVFLLMLLAFRMVSLASLTGIFAGVVLSLFQNNLQVSLCSFLLFAFIVWRHRANIQRIIEKKESKIELFRKK